MLTSATLPRSAPGSKFSAGSWTAWSGGGVSRGRGARLGFAGAGAAVGAGAAAGVAAGVAPSGSSPVNVCRTTAAPLPVRCCISAGGGVKLGDMGLSRVLGASSAQARTLVGTPLYFSPELCEEEAYDARSDVWALGCLVYHLMALRPPFEAQNQLALAKKIVAEEPPPLPMRDEQGPGVGGGVGGVVIVVVFFFFFFF